MSPANWKRCLGSSDDAHEGGILAVLHYGETVPVRMIGGIGLFFWVRLPELFRMMIDRLHAILFRCVRIAVRLARVVAVVLLWLTIVFGPIGLYPGFITGIWMALTAVGSWWGLHRQNQSRATREDFEIVRRIFSKSR